MVGVGEQIKQSELNAVATGKEFVYETRNYDSINQEIILTSDPSLRQ